MEGATTYVYKEIGGFKLPLYVFAPPQGAPDAAGPRTAVVYFHGSGWESGTVWQFAGHARQLAQHGVVAALAEYRIKEKYHGTPFDSAADAKSAIRWLRRHSAELGVDPKKIVAAGGSAGAHIAACAAVFTDRFDDPQDDRSVSARPDGLILFAPVIDTTETGYKDGIPLFGGRARELSPVHHLQRGLPPSLLFLGTGDAWVPRESIERFQRGAVTLGARCEVLYFEGRSHHFYNHPDYFELRPNLKKFDSPDDYTASFYLLERFLFEQGFTARAPVVVSSGRAAGLALLQRQTRAWETGDEAEFLATLAPNVVFAYPGKRLDRAGALKIFHEWQRDFRDSSLRVHDVVIEGVHFSAEYSFAATSVATGQRFVTGNVVVGEIKDGLITVWKEYLDGRVSRLQAAGELPVDESAAPFPWPDTPESRRP